MHPTLQGVAACCFSAQRIQGSAPCLPPPLHLLYTCMLRSQVTPITCLACCKMGRLGIHAMYRLVSVLC
jgi:hypothetical protein